MKKVLIFGILIITLGCDINNNSISDNSSKQKRGVVLDAHTPFPVAVPARVDEDFDPNKSPDFLGIGTTEETPGTTFDTVVFSHDPINQNEDGCTSDANLLQDPSGPIKILFRGVNEQTSTTPGVSTPPTPAGRPDTSIAVGPHHIVQTTNGEVAFYDKLGNLQLQQNLAAIFPMNTNSFGASFQGVDPRCIFDHFSNRFVISCLGPGEVVNSFESYDLHLGISDDDNPHGIWYLYKFRGNFDIGCVGSHFCDQPELGFDADGLYLSAFLKGFDDNGVEANFGTAFFAIEKSPKFLAGIGAKANQITKAGVLNAKVFHSYGANRAPFAVGLKPDDPAAANPNDIVTVFAFQNPFAAIPSNFTLLERNLQSANGDVPDYDIISFDVPNGASLFDHNHPYNQLEKVNFRDGSLWVCYTIEATDMNARAAIRWHEIDVGNWPAPMSSLPVVTQTGDIDVPGEHTTYPALATNSSGDVGFVYARSSSNANGLTNIRLAFRSAGTAANTLLPVTPSAIDQSKASTNSKIGDYFDIVVDPENDETFWFTGEVYNNCPSETVWETVIGSFEIE